MPITRPNTPSQCRENFTLPIYLVPLPACSGVAESI
jgi:hypothetical protein